MKTTTFRVAIAIVSVMALSYLVVMLAFIVIQMRSLPILDSQTPTFSPDGMYSAVTKEPSYRFVDRNFRVTVTRASTGKEVEIFRSKDQSPLITNERFVWSKDSRYLALIGDYYYTVDGSTLREGEIIFLIYDVPGKLLYCNADDDLRYPRMSADSANAIFGGQLRGTK